jgi:hypothetical protein
VFLYLGPRNLVNLTGFCLVAIFPAL